MQKKDVESASLFRTLDALEAEFGCQDRRRGQQGAPMDSIRATQSEVPTDLRSTKPPVEAMNRSPLETAIVRPSLGKRALRGLTRFLIVFCVGAGTTLAWQSYGDAARAMIANSSPQLGWLAPQTTSVVPPTPDVVAPPAAPSPEVQHLALGLAAVHQSVEQLTTQLAAAQQQMGGDIAKVQSDEQEILHKLSSTPPRPPAAPAHKPATVSPPPSPSAQAH